MTKARHFAHRMSRTIREGLHGDAGAGLLLLVVAALAMAVANSPLGPHWLAFWQAPLAWRPTPALASLDDWVNEGLMALVFFNVGLEIKRETLDGALAHAASRRLPVLAAGAGMAVPALIYLALTWGQPGLMRGWAIPAATDIAFAIGVLGLVGRRLPASLRLFLLSIAVVDDLGAVAIIAVGYTPAVDWLWLAAAALAWAAMVVLAWAGWRNGWVFATLAVVLWGCVLGSGVHASIAGVAGALAIPFGLDRRGHSLLLRMEDALAPWSGYVFVPLFALANAGVPIAGLRGKQGELLGVAVALGLLLGKQAGVLGAVLLAEQAGFAPRPAGSSLAQLWGVSLIAGIGFTMSLFLAALAFPGPGGAALADAARLGVFAGSLASAGLGWAVLRRSG